MTRWTGEDIGGQRGVGKGMIFPGHFDSETTGVFGKKLLLRFWKKNIYVLYNIQICKVHFIYTQKYNKSTSKEHKQIQRSTQTSTKVQKNSPIHKSI